jgi:hypothetical protein
VIVALMSVVMVINHGVSSNYCGWEDFSIILVSGLYRIRAARMSRKEFCHGSSLLVHVDAVNL